MKTLRRTSVTVLIILAAVACSELGLRAFAEGLREPLLYSNWEAQNKVSAMDALGETGGASVVFVGSSMVQTAADPELITRLLNLKRPAFNATLNGGDMRVAELWTRTVVVPRLHPKVVVVGFNTEALNDHGLPQEIVYRAMIRSPLGAGLDGRGTATDRFESWWTSHSYIVRYRFVLRHPYDALRGQDTDKAAYAVTPLGTLTSVKELHERPYRPNPPVLASGPAGWVQQLADYTLGGRELAALDLLVRDLTARGIVVVIARMPVTKDYVPLHPNGQADRDRFTRMLDAFVASHPVIFFDAEAALGDSTALFVDPVHMSGEGSRIFSTRLAEVLKQVAA
jgi:hypothetical protein